jgi:poly(A) polymerase
VNASSLLALPALRAVLRLLDGDGEEARVVGGAVRNALLGRPVHEYDIATTATPDVVIARARAAGLRSIPTGIAHGTVTVLVEGLPFEITTLREDVETDGRHAVIRFGRDFAMDARRRDFTINALSMGLDGTVHDYTGGANDLKAGRVKFIGDAGQRIREDFLRVLRFFRFSADYADGPLDADGLAAAIRERDGLAILSRERVRQELLKLLAARRVAPVTRVMAESGLLGPLLRGVAQPARLARLVAIAGDAADPVLRLSNQEAARLDQVAKALTGLHASDQPPSLGDLRALLFETGRQGACDALHLAHAESRAAADDSRWRSALRFLQDTPLPRLPFSGADLLARGFSGGRGLGEALKALQGKWIRAGFPQDPRTLASLLDEVSGNTRPPSQA